MRQHVLGPGKLQGFFEKSDNRQSHDAVLFLKADILDERFARGEIDKAEYEEKRKLLGR